MKTCRRCQKQFPHDQFYAHKKMADGHLNFCKPCVRARVGEHRANNLDAIREYDRARFSDPQRRAATYARHKLWAQRNPEKNAAHTAVGNAVRDGRLIRAPCQKCGSHRSEAHHEDYSRPLSVRWLCKLCHEAVHHGSQSA